MAVDQMFLPVEQRMEGHIMQQAVRHKDQVPGHQPLCERRDQLVVQFFQMGLRSAYQ